MQGRGEWLRELRVGKEYRRLRITRHEQAIAGSSRFFYAYFSAACLSSK
jgi:hypothetical protein